MYLILDDDKAHRQTELELKRDVEPPPPPSPLPAEQSGQERAKTEFSRALRCVLSRSGFSRASVFHDLTTHHANPTTDQRVLLKKCNCRSMYPFIYISTTDHSPGKIASIPPTGGKRG